jgi:hypothetical protein
MDLFKGLTKLVQAGSAYMQHVQFVEKAQQTQPHQRGAVLAQYVQGLSDASFRGFKLTLVMLAGKEQNAQHKGLIESLLANADAVRGSGEATPALVDEVPIESSSTTVEQGGFERNHQLTHQWFALTDDDQRVEAVKKHVLRLGRDEFIAFFANLKQMRENVLDQIKTHKANEGKAWGGFIEDQLSYGMARLRTGGHDPDYLRQLQEFQNYLNFIEWLMKVSITWKEQQLKQVVKLTGDRLAEIDKKKSTVAKPAGPDATAILKAVREFTRTGQYPGGADRLQKDMQAIAGTPAGEEMMAMLKSMGASDGGDKIEDYYQAADTLFELRWPLGVTLPIAFDRLDHKTQFSVLFQEWTRRAMEGDYALQQGDAASAKLIFEECLARAKQLAVNELIARSYERLAKVAQRTGVRAQERKHLKAAMAAREKA